MKKGKKIIALITIALFVFVSVPPVFAQAVSRVVKTIVEPSLVYERVYDFKDGLAAAYTKDKAGYIDKTGSAVVPIEYDYLGFTNCFSEGLTTVTKGDWQTCKWGFVDKTNSVIVPIEYDYAENFNEGMGLVKKDGKWGFVDKTGCIAVPIEYDYAGIFSEGLAAVEKDGKYGFVDKTGIVAVPIEFDCFNYYNYFSEGLARVKKDGKLGFVDETGSIVVPIEYDWVENFSEGLAVVRKGEWSTGKWGFIDKTGNVVIPIEYDQVGNFNEGLAAVRKNGKYGFIDKTGSVVIPMEYEYVMNFKEGLAGAEKNNKYGFIDKTGSVVVPMEYDWVGDFSEGLASVLIGDWSTGKWGFVDKTGKVVIPIEYDDVGNFNEGLAVVEKDGKWGILEISETGENPGDFTAYVVQSNFVNPGSDKELGFVKIEVSVPDWSAPGIAGSQLLVSYPTKIGAATNTSVVAGAGGKIGAIGTDIAVVPVALTYTDTVAQLGDPLVPGKAIVATNNELGLVAGNTVGDSGIRVVVPADSDNALYNNIDNLVQIGANASGNSFGIAQNGEFTLTINPAGITHQHGKGWFYIYFDRMDTSDLEGDITVKLIPNFGIAFGNAPLELVVAKVGNKSTNTIANSVVKITPKGGSIDNITIFENMPNTIGAVPPDLPQDITLKLATEGCWFETDNATCTKLYAFAPEGAAEIGNPIVAIGERPDTATITVNKVPGAATGIGAIMISNLVVRVDEQVAQIGQEIEIIVSGAGVTEQTIVVAEVIDECFIATAAFGSKLNPSVKLLRQFRDTVLLTNPPGQAFVKFYYAKSPSIAKVISNNERLKFIIRGLLVPIIALAWASMHLEISLLILLLVVTYIVAKRIRRREETV